MVSVNTAISSTLDVQSGEKVFIVGLRVVGAVDVQSQLGLFREVQEDVGGSLSKGNGNGNFTKSCFQKHEKLKVILLSYIKKITVFTKFREGLLPDVLMLLKIGENCLIIDSSLQEMSMNFFVVCIFWQGQQIKEKPA